MPGKAPKNKGSSYERELAEYLNMTCFAGKCVVTRAPLSGGGRFSANAGGTDLLGAPGLFVEAKRFERLDFRKAVRQAQRNAKLRQTTDLPLVITRRNREATGESLVVTTLSNFMEFYQAWLREKGIQVAAASAASTNPVEGPSLSPMSTLQSQEEERSSLTPSLQGE